MVLYIHSKMNTFTFLISGYLANFTSEKINVGHLQGSDSKLCLLCKILRNSPLQSMGLLHLLPGLKRAKSCHPWQDASVPFSPRLGVTGRGKLHSSCSKCYAQQNQRSLCSQADAQHLFILQWLPGHIVKTARKCVRNIFILKAHMVSSLVVWRISWWLWILHPYQCEQGTD